MGYNGTYISLDGSHHLKDGMPLYEKRFETVQSFHEPGIAPVKDETGWYFIDLNGNHLFVKKYIEAFGFYDGLAAVHDETGYYHIGLEGNPAYTHRYDWVGNFQEGFCPVRDKEGSYYHISKNGLPIYNSKYEYVGDYRYGIAVVFDRDGKGHHIDISGKRLSKNSYADLDVYHKGLARAKDRFGWGHIDLKSTMINENRYRMVEPFYNGQARIMDVMGVYRIINPEGEILHTIGDQSISHLDKYRVRWEEEIYRSPTGAIYPVECHDGTSAILKSNIALNLFITEANILRLFKGKRWTPEIIDLFERNGFGYIIMEKRKGQHLGFKRRSQKFDTKTIYEFFAEMLEYLSYLHSLGFIHSDLHPENILIDLSSNYVEITVLDHEHARILNGEKTEIHWGIWEFIPPEQIGPTGFLDERSDIYSLGVIILSMFTGNSPIIVPKPSSRKVYPEIRSALLTQKQELPSNIPLDCPFYNIIFKMIDPDPEKRPKSVKEIIQELEGMS